MEHWAKRPFVGFWKDGLLIELQARTSKSCRFLLFLHHNYQVSLSCYRHLMWWDLSVLLLIFSSRFAHTEVWALYPPSHPSLLYKTRNTHLQRQAQPCKSICILCGVILISKLWAHLKAPFKWSSFIAIWQLFGLWVMHNSCPAKAVQSKSGAYASLLINKMDICSDVMPLFVWKHEEFTFE